VGVPWLASSAAVCVEAPGWPASGGAAALTTPCQASG
jgi:hypothetical protein